MGIKKSRIFARFLDVDPAGVAPASPLTKGRILLHKLQAQVHKTIVSDLPYQTKIPEKSETFVW